MNSREAFEKWAERIGCSVSRMRTRRDIYVEYDTTALWDCWQAATERAAVLAWNAGMDAHTGFLQDSREVGSKCARTIREGNE